MANAMRAPSGDQLGRVAGITRGATAERLTGSDPSAFITHISPGPSTKAIFAPSGDHAGDHAFRDGYSVSLTTFEPSASITKISMHSGQSGPPASRSLTNAILVPSGDQVGLWSTAGGRPVSWTGFDPSAFITKMSEWERSPRLLVKAIFVPSGDQTGDPSDAGSLVRFISPDPSAFMT